MTQYELRQELIEQIDKNGLVFILSLLSQISNANGDRLQDSPDEAKDWHDASDLMDEISDDIYV